MHASVLLAASVLATVASAQTTASVTSTASSSASQVMPPAATASFMAAQVDPDDKIAWCRSQLNTCPEICGGSTEQNTCDTTGMTYSCICANGTAPDVTAYMGTLPFFICQATFAQCIASHPNDLDGQNICTTNEQCGTLNATSNDAAAATTSAAATSAAATSSSSGSGMASQTAAATGSSSSSDSAASAQGAQLATGAFAGLVFAAFALLL